MLFDTLKFHGTAFTTPFWTRIFDSVLLPIFDHVRAEVRTAPGCLATISCLQGKLPSHCTVAPAVFDKGLPKQLNDRLAAGISGIDTVLSSAPHWPSPLTHVKQELCHAASSQLTPSLAPLL